MTTINDYKHYSQREHILHRPDMWIGEKDIKEGKQIVFDGEKLIEEKIKYSSGILKMFDEALTNATDNIERYSNDPSKCTNKIKIEVTDEYISVFNNGFSIPIAKKENSNGKSIYLPQMVFAELNTSSNYDDDKERKRNGCNGVGIKLANIFSKKFYVEIVNNNQKYTQTYKNNMSVIEDPVINKSKKKDYVYIKFYLDVERFKLSEIDNDTQLMIYKRAYDTCLFNIDISINNITIPKLTFKDFCYNHLLAKKFKINKEDIIEENIYGVQICYIPYIKSYVKSYVNHIETIDHGKHVDNFFKQLDKLMKDKYKIVDKTSKNHSILFIDQTVDKPTFSGQSKSKLTTNVTTPYECLCLNILKNSNLINIIKTGTLSKINRKNKVKKPYFERLEDANMAGSKNSDKCTLFVCEGLSAASMVSSGFGVLGHDYFGIFSLTGKILNVEKASEEKIDKNIVLTQLTQTLGLEYGKTYNSVKGLRYSKIVCMKDADTDGSAIMGLLLNYIHTQFPSLLKLEDINFFNEFITPQIQVVTKDNRKEEFYNRNEFNQWYEENENNIKSIKYLKGLASNSSEDTMRYFKEFDKYLIPIQPDEDSDYYMKMAYGGTKREINLRKQWVQTCTEDTYLPRIHKEPISISDFITDDLVLFSHESCTRSIPIIYDGLKPTQRKILYTLFNLPEKDAFKLRKVFELTAKTAEKAQYHHGDSSLNGTIMGMMQTWCGSNNIPLLGHEGFIGSRFGLGQDGGAPRYVYACLNKITRYIFPKIDDELLEYIIEDGVRVEPKFYVPIIPMILINGTNGIGTGYSSYIPLHNQYEIINILENTLNQALDKNTNKNIMKKLYNISSETSEDNSDGKSKRRNNDKEFEFMLNNVVESYNKIIETEDIHLYYPGFKGSFDNHEKGYLSKGVYEWIIPNDKKNFFKCELIDDNQNENSPFNYNPCFLKITEIPISQIGFTHILNTLKNKLNKDKKSTENSLKYLIDFKNDSVTGNDSQPEKIELYLKFNNDGNTAEMDFLKDLSPMKLTNTISIDNMYLFDEHVQIHKYNTAYDIFREFIKMRYKLYVERKNMIVAKEKKNYHIINSRAKFIKMIIDKEIEMNKMSLKDLDSKLVELKFKKIDKTFNYLINLPMKWMTKEKYEELLKEKNDKYNYIKQLTKKQIEEFWLEDLKLLKEKL